MPVAGQSGSDLKDEYLDACENIRHWQNMRFAQLTLLLASMFGVLSALSQVSDALMRVSLKIAALIIVFVFWVMDERVVQYWQSYRRRAVALELELGFKQHSYTPSRHLVTAGNAVRLFYVMLVAFWILGLVRG
jgi:hypothetical protein